MSNVLTPARSVENSYVRIEEVRRLRALGWNRGEIKRHCAQAWGIKRRCVEKYLVAADKRNAEYLKESGGQTLSSSLSFWIQKLTKTESDIELLAKEIDRLNELLKHDGIEPKLRALYLRELDGYRKRRFVATEQSMEIYDRIDRLRGHVHSGGSASVLIQQQFINGGQASSSPDQRRERLEMVGLLPSGGLPTIIDAPAVGLPPS